LTHRKSKVSGWGLTDKKSCLIYQPYDSKSLTDQAFSINKQICFRGGGYAYGDCAIPSASSILSSVNFNKFISYDKETGILECQSGVTLEDILSITIEDGWTISAMPGTSRATVGGCIACDVHGKNHYHQGNGSFGNSVVELTLLTAEQRVIKCSEHINPDIFKATIGGLGLTGFILKAKLKLKSISSPFISQEIVSCKNLTSLIENLSKKRDFEYSVAWIDGTARGNSLGRGFIILGSHYNSKKHTSINWSPINRISIKNFHSKSLINQYSIKLLNNYLYFKHKRLNNYTSRVRFNDFFFPLDKIATWNHNFFRKGLVEYQVILPKDNAINFIETFLAKMQNNRIFPFFVSLKKMGKNNGGYLSFPEAGIAFSASFSATNPKLFVFLDEMDNELIKFGGKIYLAKDSRAKPHIIAKMYPMLNNYKNICAELDPNNEIQTAMSERLMLK
jgi:decaprenylphospho-beta-D-ribofuranose 2-oxidase